MHNLKPQISYIPFILILMSSLSNSYGQSIKRQSISSIGSSGSIGSISINQTAGQSYNTAATIGNGTVTPGFQQPATYKIEEVNTKVVPQLSIVVYPNPANHRITISSKDEIRNSIISVTDLQGRVILKSNIPNLISHDINCDQWQSGIYFITVYDSNQKSKTLKLTISK